MERQYTVSASGAGWKIFLEIFVLSVPVAQHEFPLKSS